MSAESFYFSVRASVFILAIALVASAAAPARADDALLSSEEPADGHGHRLIWPDNWGRWTLTDTLTSAGAGILTALFLGLGPRFEGQWDTPNALDAAARDALGVHSPRPRQRLLDASDLTLSAAVSIPLLIDAMVIAWWYHDSPDVARELALLAVEVQFITSVIQTASNVFASRQRPYGRRCGDTVDASDRDCIQPVRYRSFFSGHTSQSFAGAVTSCMFHARLPLYERKAYDRLACATGLLAATTTGMLRIFGDMHYLTDVLTGALVGSAIGVLIPALRMRSGTRFNRPLGFYGVPVDGGFHMGVMGHL